MKLYFSNLSVLLQALLVSLPDEYQRGVSSFTIQMPTHGLNQRGINTGWIPSITNGLETLVSEEGVGPLFAKKKKNKKKNFAKKSTRDDGSDTTQSPSLSNELPMETSNTTSDELNAEEATISTENNDNIIVAESDYGRDETQSGGTITDVLNTLLDDEENRVESDEGDEPDISAYKLYLQWVKEQESVKDQPQPDTSQDDDRLKEIVDEAKKKFSEEDKVQEDQMEAAKQAREKAEQMERMQVEELKKRFEEEDKIRAQQLEAAKEAMKKAEELKNIKAEELKKKFQDEMKVQQLSEEGSESSSFENEEPIPFPDLQKGDRSPRVDTSVKKQNQKGSGRSWTNASEQIRLSRASKEPENKFEASMNEETVISGLSESDLKPEHIGSENIDTADDGAAILTEDNSYQLSDLSIVDAKSKEITETERLAASKLSEVRQRALLAARLKMESDEKARRASDDEMNKKSETSYETREEALLSAKLKLEEIRMQKPNSKLGSTITTDEVPEIQDSHGDVDTVLDSYVDEKLGDLHISEAEDEHHHHEDIDLTESIVEQYGSVDTFLLSVNGNYEGDDDGESDDVDMTDTIIAQYGSLEAFFSSLESGESNTEETSQQRNELLNEHDNKANKSQTSLVQSKVDDGSIADSVEIPEIISDDDHEEDDEYDMTGSIIVQRHVYRLSPTEGSVKSSFSIEDRQYFKVKQDSTLEAYGDRSFILRKSSKKQSVFDFELGSIVLAVNGLKEDTDMEDASRNLAWLNAYAATLYCIANPLILRGQGLQISSGSGLAGILSILGSGYSDQSGSDTETSSSEENFSFTPKNLSKILMTDANESNILKCIDNLRVGMFPSNKVELGLLDPSEEVSPNLFRSFDFVLGFDCANDPYTLARIFASVLKEGSNHRFVHITFSEKEQRKLKNAVDSRLRMYSKVDDIVMDKLVLTPLVFNTQEEADLEINNVESSFWNEDVEVKEAETLSFTALTGYQDVEVTQERSQGHFVDNDTW